MFNWVWLSFIKDVQLGGRSGMYIIAQCWGVWGFSDHDLLPTLVAI